MEWKKFNRLGAGSYGSVFLAAPANASYFTDSVVAVKSAYGVHHSTYLRAEASFLRALRNSPYVIQAFGTDESIEDEAKVFNLLLEFAPGGSFDKIIKSYNGRNMSESLVASYTYMLLKGLSSIHDKGIVHCDLKPENIMVFPQGGINILKIADFGLSKVLVPEATGKICGTTLYASPEVVIHGLNVKARDIWSLGCIVIEMITGKEMWTDSDELQVLQQVAYTRPMIPKNISEDAKDFLKRCLERDHKKRWTAEMLLNHPFIVKNLRLSNLETHWRQHQAVFPTLKSWICSEGMFSTPLIEFQSHQVYKPYELFPEKGGGGLPFALSCGGIY